jgi:hypothetical protein
MKRAPKCFGARSELLEAADGIQQGDLTPRCVIDKAYNRTDESRYVVVELSVPGQEVVVGVDDASHLDRKWNGHDHPSTVPALHADSFCLGDFPVVTTGSCFRCLGDLNHVLVRDEHLIHFSALLSSSDSVGAYCRMVHRRLRRRTKLCVEYKNEQRKASLFVFVAGDGELTGGKIMN